MDDEDDEKESAVGICVARSAVFVCMTSRYTPKNKKHTCINNYGVDKTIQWVTKPSANRPLVAIGPFTLNADLFRSYWQKIRLRDRRLAFALCLPEMLPDLTVFMHPDIDKKKVLESVSNLAAFKKKRVEEAVKLFDESLPDSDRVCYQRI